MVGIWRNFSGWESARLAHWLTARMSWPEEAELDPMSSTQETAQPRPLRADARDNRRRLLMTFGDLRQLPLPAASEAGPGDSATQ
jgi:hypothetical protein